MAELKGATPRKGPRPPVEELERRLGLAFRDRERLERALSHSSLRQGSTGGRDGRSNERLEFLGDRVLGLVVAEKLFETFPRADEGALSLRLNALVSADACAGIAEEIDLEAFIRHGGDLKRVKGRYPKNVRADALEALIAAAYLSEGLDAARAMVLRLWAERFANVANARQDAKTTLQEWAHGRGDPAPRYETVGRDGPDHDPVFTVRVTVEGAAPAQAQGRSKRLAEQAAAQEVLVREKIWKDEA